jgi:hypothetical protein
MIGTTSGRVIKVLEHGFVLWRWPNRRRVVSTQVEGSKLGLRWGDRVVVYGGPSNDGRVWLSSGAYKQRRFRSAVEIPCSLWDLEVRKLRR